MRNFLVFTLLLWPSIDSRAVAELDAPREAQTTSASDLLQSIDIGIKGKFKVGQWTSVRVTVDASHLEDGDQIGIELLDPDGGVVRFENSTPNWTRDATNRSASAVTLVKFGRMSGEVRVRWERHTNELAAERTWSAAQLPTPLPTDHQIVVSVGKDIGVANALAIRSKGSTDPATHVQITPNDLPQHLLGYSSIDTVVLPTLGLGVTGNATATSSFLWQPLVAWVQQGGSVIICGSGHSELLTPETGDLHGLVPGRVMGVLDQRQTTGLEQYVRADVRLDRDAQGRFAMPMADLELAHGRVETWVGFGNDQRPCITRAAVGLGQVVFAGVDLDSELFDEWPDRGKLLEKLLDLTLDGVYDQTYRSEVGLGVGYTDLVGQVRGALDQFRGVRLVPFSWIAGLAAIYILVMGPLDYWLLNRWKRPELTWYTFLVTVIAFSFLATWLAFRWKGYDALINQITVIDADLASGQTRGITWAHLYSPKTQRVDVASRPTFAIAAPKGSSTSWQGLPGDGFGGLNRRDATSPFDEGYECQVDIGKVEAATIDLQQMPIAVWSSRSIAGHWWGQNAWQDIATESFLTPTTEGSLIGSITNPWPVDLKNTVLIYDRWAYRIGSVGAGSTLPIDVSTGTDLQTLLTRRKVKKGRNVVTPWDRNSTDVNRIIELLMFYDVAKGPAYTQLKHRYQDELDWSQHLSNGQAILWGQCSEPGTEIAVNGRAVAPHQAFTFCRLLIPLSRVETLNRD